MEPDTDRLSADQLLRIAFDAVAVDDSRVPDELGRRVASTVVRGADRVRHPGWDDPGGDPLSALSAFITTAAELGDVSDSLSEVDWERTTPVDGVTARDVAEHLVGVERYVLGQLDRRPRVDAPRREDHWLLASKAASDVRDETGSFVAATWWSELLDVVAASSEMAPDDQVTYHHLVGSLRGLLILRTFELWTHGDDIRQAAGLPLNLLDEGRLSLMVNQLMRVLPLGLALVDESRPGRAARINLTGEGGGSFDVPLAFGEVPGPPDVTLTAEVMHFCRLASGRLAPRDLDVVVDGDADFLGVILAGATAFAAD